MIFAVALTVTEIRACFTLTQGWSHTFGFIVKISSVRSVAKRLSRSTMGMEIVPVDTRPMEVTRFSAAGRPLVGIGVSSMKVSPQTNLPIGRRAHPSGSSLRMSHTFGCIACPRLPHIHDHLIFHPDGRRRSDRSNINGRPFVESLHEVVKPLNRTREKSMVGPALSGALK